MSDADKKQAPTVKKTDTKESKQEVGSQQPPVLVVYIGPDIPGAKQYTTYNAGLPDALKEKIKEHPFFNSLVIPVEGLAKANAELAKEGSALNVLYRRASGK